jgi:5-methylthioadenosine/S-adenosylhomocysteine deaminase
MDEKTGILAPDYSADLLIIDTGSPNMQPMYDPYIQIAYSMENIDIITSVVNGRPVMEDHQILTMDEELILREVDSWMNGASVYDFISLNND